MEETYEATLRKMRLETVRMYADIRTDSELSEMLQVPMEDIRMMREGRMPETVPVVEERPSELPAPSRRRSWKRRSNDPLLIGTIRGEYPDGDVDEIAAKLGISRISVYQWAHVMGVRRSREYIHAIRTRKREKER